HRTIDVAGPPLVRALEEHVLLKVRVAELVRLLVAHAHRDPEVDGDDVGGAVLLVDEAEPVRQDRARGRWELAAGRRRRGGGGLDGCPRRLTGAAGEQSTEAEDGERAQPALG